MYLTPLVGGLLADRYLGSKRSVKFGALVMAVGYLTLNLGAAFGQRPSPLRRSRASATTVTVDKASADKQQYVTSIGAERAGDQGPRRTAASIWSRPDGKVAADDRQGRFRAGGERSPFFTLVLLVGLVDGHDGQRLLQAQHLDDGR